MQFSQDDLVNYTTKVLALTNEGMAPNAAMRQALESHSDTKLVVEFVITTTKSNPGQIVAKARREIELAFGDNARLSRSEIQSL